MKRLIFFTFFISIIFADDIIVYNNDSNIALMQEIPGADPCSALKAYDVVHVINGKLYVYKDNLVTRYNGECVLNNSETAKYTYYSGGSCSPSFDPPIDKKIYKLGDFCEKRQGYYYDSKLNAWIPVNSDSSIICSPLSFNDGANSCINVCPAGSVYFKYEGQNYCIPKDVSLLSKILDTDLSGCSFSKVIAANNYHFISLSCPDGTQALFQYADHDVSPSSSNSNSSSNSSSTNSSPIVCGPDTELVIYENGDATCVKKSAVSVNSGTTSSESGGTTSSKGSGTSSKGSGTASSESNGTTSSNSSTHTSCPDPCDVIKKIGYEQIIVSTDPYTCYKITKPVYDNCVLMYHKEDGVCVAGCKGSDSGDSSGSGNSTSSENSGDSKYNEYVANTLNDVSGKLNTVNANLRNINDTLQGLKDLQPDGSFDPGEGRLTSQESSIFNQFSTFFSNVKNVLNNTFNSLDKVVDMAKNKKNYQITLFQGASASCPLSVNIYGRLQTIDICKFISPYKSLLQLFFTILFDFSVLIGFFKIVIFRRV